MSKLKTISKKVLQVLSHNEEALNRAVIREVKFPLSLEAEDTIDEVIDSLRYHKGVYAKRGIAIAANQVGVQLRFFCLADYAANIKNIHKRMEIICNPRIIDSSKETFLNEEGCLSIPEILADVRRPLEIVVEYENILGKKIKRELANLDAQVFQHELDHLNGIHMLKIAESTKVNPLYTEFMIAQGLQIEENMQNQIQQQVNENQNEQTQTEEVKQQQHINSKVL